jgi:hypothetical protein
MHGIVRRLLAFIAGSFGFSAEQGAAGQQRDYPA